MRPAATIRRSGSAPSPSSTDCRPSASAAAAASAAATTVACLSGTTTSRRSRSCRPIRAGASCSSTSACPRAATSAAWAGSSKTRAHLLGGVVEVGSAQCRRRGRSRVSAPTVGHRVAHEVGVLLGHEVVVAGEAGGDHGLAERHGLREREPEALAAVKRDVAVAPRRARRLLGGAQRAVEDVDVGAVAEAGRSSSSGAGACTPLIVLMTELRALAGREGAPERLDQADRVLALRSCRRSRTMNRKRKPSGSPQVDGRAAGVGRRDRQRDRARPGPGGLGARMSAT